MLSRVHHMWLLLVCTLLGGVLAPTLFWLWQGDLVFALLLAPIGGGFAALLGGICLGAARTFREFLATKTSDDRSRHSALR